MCKVYCKGFEYLKLWPELQILKKKSLAKLSWPGHDLSLSWASWAAKNFPWAEQAELTNFFSWASWAELSLNFSWQFFWRKLNNNVIYCWVIQSQLSQLAQLSWASFWKTWAELSWAGQLSKFAILVMTVTSKNRHFFRKKFTKAVFLKRGC